MTKIDNVLYLQTCIPTNQSDIASFLPDVSHPMPFRYIRNEFHSRSCNFFTVCTDGGEDATHILEVPKRQPEGVLHLHHQMIMRSLVRLFEIRVVAAQMVFLHTGELALMMPLCGSPDALCQHNKATCIPAKFRKLEQRATYVKRVPLPHRHEFFRRAVFTFLTGSDTISSNKLYFEEQQDGRLSLCPLLVPGTRWLLEERTDDTFLTPLSFATLITALGFSQGEISYLMETLKQQVHELVRVLRLSNNHSIMHKRTQLIQRIMSQHKRLQELV